eukprot:1932920-Rhodomonas_salina.1
MGWERFEEEEEEEEKEGREGGGRVSWGLHVAAMVAQGYAGEIEMGAPYIEDPKFTADAYTRSLSSPQTGTARIFSCEPTHQARFHELTQPAHSRFHELILFFIRFVCNRQVLETEKEDIASKEARYPYVKNYGQPYYPVRYLLRAPYAVSGTD